jgi:hypothetical protein
MAIMADTLVIVCCHSIFHGTDPNDESHWALQPFQRSTISKPGEHTTFLKHIRMALNFQGTSDKTVVFSGGHTNPDYPDLSEAQSYLNAAVAADGSESVNSVILEDQATDTYQNILFSILKYHAVKGCYPGSIVVVTHDFKSQRVHLHQQAIRWSKSFRVYALNPPFSRK